MKTKLMTLLIASALGASTFISACSKKETLPTNQYEKVAFAFKGVEKALKNSSGSRSSHSLTPKGLKSGIQETTIETIISYLSVEEDASRYDLDYNETPLVQFQYIKALYEEFDNDYTFNTKVHTSYTGTIYYDFANRQRSETQDNPTNYSCDFAMSLNIDANDLITAEVGFKLDFTTGEVVRHQQFYVSLYLDYDMNDLTPTFELTMLVITNCLDFPEGEEYSSLEYDYVKVEENVLKEVHKFGVGTPDLITDYDDDQFIYKYVVLRAFKNNTSYFTESSFRKEEPLKNAVIHGLGLDTAYANSFVFFAKTATVDNRLKTVIDRFNGIIGRDIIYTIVYTGSIEKWEDDREPGPDPEAPKWISATPHDYTSPIDQVTEDCRLIDLFTPRKDEQGNDLNYYVLTEKQGEENILRTFENLNDLKVKFKSDDYLLTDWVDVTDGHETITELLLASGDIIGTYSDYIGFTIDIALGEDEEIKLDSSLGMMFMNEDLIKSMMKKWPARYLNAYLTVKDLVPVFDGENIIYNPDVRDERRGVVSLEGATQSEVAAYRTKLLDSGFKDTSGLFQDPIYSKRLDSENVLEIELFEGSVKDETYPPSITFRLVEKAAPTKTVRDAILELFDNENIDIPEFPSEVDYQLTEDFFIRIPESNEEEIVGYINSFTDNEFSIYTDDYGTVAYKYVNDTFYKVTGSGKTIRVNVTPCVFSFVGLDGNWEDLNTDEWNFGNLSRDASGFSFSRKMSFQAGQKFKIVLNHSWFEGGYGYDRIDMGEGKEIHQDIAREEGEYDNIVVTRNCNYTIVVKFASYHSGSLAETLGAIQIQFQ